MPQTEDSTASQEDEGSAVLPELEIEKVRKLNDKCTAHELAGESVTGVVVNEVEIAEWVMRNIETDIGAELMGVRVVLKECVEKRTRRETVTKTSSKQVCCERSVRKPYIVAAIADVHI